MNIPKKKKNSDSSGVSKHCRRAKPFWGRGQGWWWSSRQMFRPEMAARNCFPKSPPGSHWREWSMTMGAVPTTKPLCEVAQSCPTLCDPMDCSLPASSVYGIFQARVLEGGAIAFSLLSVYGDLNGKEIQKRGDICIDNSLCSKAETNTTF